MENSIDNPDLPPEIIRSVGNSPETHKFEFHGNAVEYFMIWFANLFMTIITFGIYAPWAKVRTKRYMYRNTILNGEPFDYTGNPVAILKGYLVIMVAFIPVVALQAVFPGVGGIIMILVYLSVLPYLIYKSLKFNARNLLYRNIRCSFLGTVSESYRINAGIAILIPLTLGLIFPYWDFRKRQYMFSNLAYGNEVFSFRGAVGSFYRYYIIASALPLAIILVPAFLALGFDTSSFNEYLKLLFPGIGEDIFSYFIVAAIASVYIVFLLSFMAVKQYLFIILTNYTMNNLDLGRTVNFHSGIGLMKYLWIQAVNALAISFSMGLLYPWAKIRKMKYVMESISMTTSSGFESFLSVAEPDVSAIGDAGADFFDIDLAL